MHYYQFNIGDYASHTRHLSPIEDIAYRRLLDLAYTLEKPIKNDLHEVSRLINLRDHRIEIEDVLNEFWELTDDGWVHGRVLKELEKAQYKTHKAKESAKSRWNRIKNANACENDANALKNDANAQEIDATQDTGHITHNPLHKDQKILCQADEIQDQKPERKIDVKKRERREAAKRVLQFLNTKALKNFSPTDANLKLLMARLAEGFTESDMRMVIAMKTRAWLEDAKMNQYLRPATLFNATNFSNYAGELKSL